MGAKDIKAKDYLSDNGRFADLCNYVLFKGQQVIKPEELYEQDVTELLSMYSEINEENVQKWRDLLKHAVIKFTDVVTYILLGIENQSEIHYAMPVKAMMYDALNYSAQVKRVGRRHKERRDRMTSAEFLSGFKKNDKINPIITITLYWGVDEWDGPRNLYEMFESFDTSLEPFIPDYHINLVAPYLIQPEEFQCFQTSLGPTLKFLKYAEDKKSLEELIHTDPAYMNMDNESVAIINTYAGVNFVLEEKDEVKDMCKAIEEMKQEYAERKLAEELVKTVENAMTNFHATLAEACVGLGYSVEAYESAKRSIK